MKIDKLYTSIGFGLYLKSLTLSEFCELSGADLPSTTEGVCGLFRIDSLKLRLRDDYDTFLRGNTKKEMFVNELPEPTANNKEMRDCWNGMGYVEWLRAWREAEKKVIFKDDYKISTYDNSILRGNRAFLEFGKSGAIYPAQTLHDLAEATKGELKLQNVEL